MRTRQEPKQKQTKKTNRTKKTKKESDESFKITTHLTLAWRPSSADAAADSPRPLSSRTGQYVAFVSVKVSRFEKTACCFLGTPLERVGRKSDKCKRRPAPKTTMLMLRCHVFQQDCARNSDKAALWRARGKRVCVCV